MPDQGDNDMDFNYQAPYPNEGSQQQATAAGSSRDDTTVANTLQMLLHQIDALKIEIQALKGTGPTTQTPAPNPLSSTQQSPSSFGEFRSSAPKIKAPGTFNGERTKLKAFLSQLELYFALHHAFFTTDYAKVMYLGSLLRDTAFLWFEPLLHQVLDPTSENHVATKQGFENYQTFTKVLITIFGEVDREAQAEREISALKQTGSAANYTSKFQQIVQHLHWNASAQCFYYYQGLKDAIKDEIAKDGRPTNLAELIEKAVRIDNRLYDRKKEKGYQRTTFPSATHTTSALPDPEPMDLSATVSSKARGPLTASEKEHRRTNNLCLYCGASDHKVDNCPICAKKKNPKGKTQQ